MRKTKTTLPKSMSHALLFPAILAGSLFLQSATAYRTEVPTGQPTTAQAHENKNPGPLAGCWKLMGEPFETGFEKILMTKELCYKVYGKTHVLTIANALGEDKAYDMAITPFRMTDSKSYTENGYEMECLFHEDKVMFVADSEKNYTGLRTTYPNEIWQRSALSEIYPTTFRLLTTVRNEQNIFSGVWKYEGQFWGKANESYKNVIYLNAYGDNHYKIYDDDSYCAFDFFTIDSKNGHYIFSITIPESFEYLSDESIIERGTYEISITWIDQDSYYLTYFNRVNQRYVSERWVRSELPENAIQALKECGY